MRLLTRALLVAILVAPILVFSFPAKAKAIEPTPADAAAGEPQAATSNATITLPAGTQVDLALTGPVWTKTAKAGDPIYAVTDFPVAAGGAIAIPAGTYVQGQIDTLNKPGWLSPHAEFQIHFSKLIFANGYTVELPQPPQTVLAADPTLANSWLTSEVATAVATPYVQVSSSSDILMDNGAQIEMVLQLPLVLDAQNVAAAAKDTRTPPPIPTKSATMCRPTPSTPGTPDTVIPGTPGTPGTPDTVIPSGTPGVPDTVIPGIPATPGTPDTIIPGSPSTPGTVCPGPPIVAGNGKTGVYSGNFELASPVVVGGTQLAAGSYQAKWTGPAPSGEIEFLQKGKHVATAEARILTMYAKAPASVPETKANSNGTESLISLRFAGQTLALYFEPGSGPKGP